MANQRFKKLSSHLAKLPGIGPRQASRLALAMIDWSHNQLAEFAQAVNDLKNGNIVCNECFNLSDTAKCSICSNPVRDKNKIAVVEKAPDVDSLEKSGHYKGTYHVLGGAISPAYGILPENLKIPELASRIKNLKSANSATDIEVILATNPNMTGETTALYIEELLKPFVIKVTRLARGLASGTSLEYADESTLANALKHRK